MKKNKWFILAALLGLILSLCFMLVGCSLFENCNGSGCSSSSMNCSGMDCSGMNFSGMSCR